MKGGRERRRVFWFWFWFFLVLFLFLFFLSSYIRLSEDGSEARRGKNRGCVKKREKMENKPSWKKRKKGAFRACVKGLRGGDFFSNSVFAGGLCRIFLEGEDFSLGFSGWFGRCAVRGSGGGGDGDGCFERCG